jgi:hypothetical protein
MLILRATLCTLVVGFALPWAAQSAEPAPGPCERWISVTALLAACLRPQSALRPLKRGEGAADYPQRNSQRPWISLFGQVFLVQNNDQ